MNSFKTFINKVGDRVREVTPQGNSVVEGIVPKGNLVEGFVCPTCFKKYESPETLQKHYEDDHMNPSANYLCPVCQARLNSQEDLELHYSSNHNEKDFSNHSLELLKDELIGVTSSLREERWHSEGLKKEVERLHEAFQKKNSDETDVYIHKFQLDAAEEAKTNLSSEVLHLRKQLAEALQHTGVLITENQTLEGKLSTYHDEKTGFLCKIEDLNAEMESYKHFKEEAHKIVEKLNENISIKDEMYANLKACQLLLEENEIQMKLGTEENEQLKKEITEKEEEKRVESKNLENLKNEFNLMKDTLNSTNDELNGLSAKFIAREKILEGFQNSIEPISEDALKPENAQLLQEYTNKIAHLDKQNKAISSELEDAIKQKLDAESFAENTTEKFNAINEKLTSVHSLFGQTKNQLNTSEQEILKNEYVIKELKAQNELLHLEKEKKESLEKACETLQMSLDESQELENSKSVKLNESERELIAMSESHDRKCLDLEDKAAELNKLKEVEGSLLGQFDDIVDKLTLKENQVTSLFVEKERLLEEITLRMTEIKSLQTNLSHVESNESELKKQLVISKENIDTLNDSLVVCQRDMNSNKFEHADTLMNLNTEIDSRKDKIRELEQVVQLMTVSKENCQQKNDNLKEDLRKCVAETKCAMDSYDLVVETNTAYHEQIKETEIVLQELKMNKIHLENDLTTLTGRVTEAESKRTDCNSRAAALDEKLGALESELAGLAGDKLELEVRLEAASEERQSMLNRCVSSEKEVERLKQEINLLRRKLQDSTAALHDLGRANQSLQIETSKLAGRKWMEDSDVPNCSKCAKNFTVTNRRHHCRNCGQIFCNDCSSKLAPLDFKKKAVRVCDSCHLELSTKA